MAQFFKNYGLITLFSVTALLVTGFCVIWPVLNFDWPTEETASAARAIRWSRLQHTITTSLSEAAAAIWVFFLGACVGSFLNVVVYRVPLGQSVVSHASYCPKCGEGIRPSDNIPVIGWLKLKGECRNCHLPISSRYPIVEFTIGSLFLFLHFVQVTSAGANIPVRPIGFRTGAMATLFQPNLELLGLTLYHCYLLCSIFSWAMILRDGNRVPARAVVTTFAIGAVPAICFPMLLPFPVMTAKEALAVLPAVIPATLSRHVAAAATVFVGACVGAVIATVFRIITRKWSSVQNVWDVPSWMLIGIFLGWQAVTGTLLVTIVWMLVTGLVVCCTKPDPEPPPEDKILKGLEPLAGIDPIPEPPKLTQRQLVMLGVQLGLFVSLAIHHAAWRLLWEQFYPGQ